VEIGASGLFVALIVGVRVAPVDKVTSRIARHIHVQHGTGRASTDVVVGVVTKVRERCVNDAVSAHRITQMTTIEQVENQVTSAITRIDSERYRRDNSGKETHDPKSMGY